MAILVGFLVGSCWARSWRSAAINSIVLFNVISMLLVLFLLWTGVYNTQGLLIFSTKLEDKLLFLITQLLVSFITAIFGMIGFALARLIRGPVENWKS